MRWIEFRPTGIIAMPDPNEPQPPTPAPAQPVEDQWPRPKPEICWLTLDALDQHPVARAAVLKLYNEIFGEQPPRDGTLPALHLVS